MIAEDEDELRGELERIGRKAFRRKYGPRAHLNHELVSYNVTRHLLDEIDREDRARHDGIILACTVLITLATIATAIGVFIVR